MSKTIPIPDAFSDKYLAEDREAVETIIGICNAHNRWSRSALARASGVSRPMVYAILAGEYPSPPTPYLQRMLDVLQRDMRRQGGEQADTFVPTSVYRLVEAACHRARKLRSFAVVSAYVGTGKTTAIKQYAQTGGEVYLIEATPDMSSAVMLDDLVDQTGAIVHKSNRHGRGTKAERLSAVIRALKGSDALLILDEAETVTQQTLEYVRRIRDLANIGVVLAGTEKLKPLVQDPRGRFGQISSRVTFWPPIVKAITEDDATALAESLLPDQALTPDVLDALWQMCDGSARVLADALIPGIRDYGLRKGIELSPELVYKVGQEILGFRRPVRRAAS